jgi:hypothetical protein
MARAMTFAKVCELGLALPGVERGSIYGTPALKVAGELVTCMAIHRSAEPGTLAVRVEIADRDELIAADPGTYYLTDHYVNYPVVLVRLSRIHADALKDLLRQSWAFAKRRAAAKPRRRSPSRRATSRRR